MRKKSVLISALTAISILIVSSPPSSAASARPEKADPVQMCTTVLGSPDPVTRTAQIKSVTCTTDAAIARKTEQAATAAASVQLIRFWEHANYSGYSNAVYGEPCDEYGYGISYMYSLHWWPGGSMPHDFTSYRVFNGCNQVGLFMNTNYGGQASGWRTGDSSNVGNPYNDWWGSTLFRGI